MVDFNALVPWRNNKSEVATKRDDFFDPFVSFRREMDRMFDRFFDGLPASTGTGWQALTPAVDVDETDKEMVITAELPGVSDKDVNALQEETGDLDGALRSLEAAVGIHPKMRGGDQRLRELRRRALGDVT